MNMETKQLENWVSTKDIALHLGVTIVTIRNWIRKETIPCHKVGKLWKFRISEVDAWITSGQAGEADNNG